MMSRSAASGGLCIFVLWTLAAEPALAQRPTTRPSGPLAAVSRLPEYAATARISERVLNEQAGLAIVLPSEPGEYGEGPERLSGTVLAKVNAAPRPLPDGYTVGRRPGRVERQDGGFGVRLEHVPQLPDAPPLRVLPNARLALLEAVLAETDPGRRFLVTGRITEFQGLNYILIENLAELTRREDEKPSPPAAHLPAPEVAPGPEKAAATRPAEETETRPSGREPTAEELIRQLMRDRPARSLNFPGETQPTHAVPGTMPPGTDIVRPLPEPPPEIDTARWQEQALLSDRQARLVPGEAGEWILAFEDPGKNPTDRPIRVLPSRLLEMAIHLTGGGAKPVVLIVSGEVTAHRGTNYVLLRKVLARRNMGNLR